MDKSEIIERQDAMRTICREASRLICSLTNVDDDDEGLRTKIYAVIAAACGVVEGQTIAIVTGQLQDAIEQLRRTDDDSEH